MKKILFILILILFTQQISQATEEINLEFDENFQKLTINDSKQLQQEISDSKIAINETDNTPSLDAIDTSNSMSQHTRFYDGLSHIAHDLHDLKVGSTNKPASLFEEQLTKHFENGPIESFHTWTAIQNNFNTTISESGNANTTYNVGLINIIFDAKTRGGKDNFRLMLDPTPQNVRPYFQPFIQDVYYETKRIPHHTILIGNSRTGTGFEGAQSPYTLPFLNRSQISRNLANVRKVGVRVKGSYSLVDYDLGGYSSDTFFSEFMPGVEFDGWVNLKPLAKTNGKYGELTTGGGIVAGSRNATSYVVGGAYIGYSYKNFWTKMEYAVSDGSNGGSGLTDKRRQGWYVTLGYHITKKLEVLVRYDEFDPDKSIRANQQREYTAGINYYIKGQAFKVLLNYVFCQNEAAPNSHRIILGTQLAL